MPFFPLGDFNPRRRIGLPVVTYGLIALNTLIFLYMEGQPAAVQGTLTYGYGFIPAVFDGSAELHEALKRLPAWATLLSYQFLHGGWDHLIGNMLFLWVFGDNVEDDLGHARYLAFYLLSGVAGALAHFAVDPASAVPLVGASGAISGVLGAYLLLHPFARVLVLIVALPLRLPAWLLLLLWFGFQFLGDDEGVAWMAHVGGFVAGAILAIPLRARGVPLLAREQPKRILVVASRVQRRRAPSAGQEPGRRRRRGPWG